MNQFIEIAVTKYVNEYPNTNKNEVLSYLESLGYAKEELENLVLKDL